MSEKTRLLFRKGAVDILQYLYEKDEAGYYEMYKLGYVVSRQSFAQLLKMLEREGLANRHVLDTHPPRVNYSLTQKGKRIGQHLKSITAEFSL